MDWTTSHSERGSLFESKRYSDWSTLAEDLSTGTLGASFLLAPMAMSLKQRGIPIRIVYLGHRDGTTMMVRADSGITSLAGLRGKRILVPSMQSNQHLWIARMAAEQGIPLAEFDIRVAPPPDMPALLETGAAAAYAVGEPHAARTEMAGTGKVLYLTKDTWPDFISCVLVVREELIRNRRSLVQELVDGIAGSGVWLDAGMEHRMAAAEVVGKHYYNQNPELLKFVLSKPPDRVKYTRLSPHKQDLDEIMRLALELGILEREIAFEEYCDPSFAEGFDGLARADADGESASEAGAAALSPRLQAALLPLLVVALLLLLWQLFLGGDSISDFPKPAQVARGFAELATVRPGERVPRLVSYSIASVFRVTWGFLLAAAIAIPLGLVMGWYWLLFRALNPLIQVLRPISPIAWIPIAILLLRNDDPRSIFLIFVSTFFPIVVSTVAAVHNIPRVYIRSAQNFGVTGWKLFKKVVVPCCLPQILTGLRIAVGIAWLVVVAAEMIAVDSGLGYLIIDARNAGGSFHLIVAAMLVIGGIGLVLDLLIRRLERFDEVRWGYARRG